MTTGYHEGELTVQRRAGVSDMAARLSGMLAPGELRGGVLRFLVDRTFAVLAGRSADGRLWASPLSGPPGFLHSPTATTLNLDAVPGPGDPLHDLAVGEPVGLVVIEFATRRRVRINGTLSAVRPDQLSIDVEQAYGNCPRYIQRRQLSPVTMAPAVPGVRRSDHLEATDIAMIRGADTFFIGTTHPVRGTDASHRGGPAGFVRVDGNELWWPDYRGNNMFNTLGNLTADPAAALLFPDFVTGRTLQLSGRAITEWTSTGAPGDDDATGRLVHFAVDQVAAGDLLQVRAGTTTAHDDNPPLSDDPGRQRADGRVQG